MDLIILLAFVLGTNVATFLITTYTVYQQLKDSKLLPIFRAHEAHQLRAIEMRVDVSPEYQDKFDADVRKCGMVPKCLP